MRRKGKGLPTWAEKQDIKNWYLSITRILCFVCLPANAILIIIFCASIFKDEEKIEAYRRIPAQNMNQVFNIKSRCKSWCERDVSSWNWVTDVAKENVANNSIWHVHFRDTNMLVVNQGRKCCLSIDDMGSWVYGCRWRGKNGGVYFSTYVYDMLNETAAVLTTAKRALVLGMGLGGIPQVLVNSWKNLNLDVVEVSKSVVDVAKEAFCFPDNMRINIILEDAFLWIAGVEDRSYDVVYIDIFLGKVIPKEAKNSKFFQEVYRILKPSGIVTSNILFKDEQYFKKISSYLRSCTTFRDRFITCIK